MKTDFGKVLDIMTDVAPTNKPITVHDETIKKIEELENRLTERLDNALANYNNTAETSDDITSQGTDTDTTETTDTTATTDTTDNVDNSQND